MIRKKSGFTLVELLVVIAIIAVLVSIAIIQYTNLKKSAYRNVVRNDLKNSLTMIIGFISSYKSFPSNGSCGPGPISCDLNDGYNTITNAINVSRDVIIEWRITQNGCSDGSTRIFLIGRHSELKNWTATFDSCSQKYTNF
ncbi:prepilin-type N-terminal cleavage/methylation domain-containing protein [Persephonella sp.]|uniref:type IV pilin protein n=1 Tax=Persephonella sp. TaxID=2060922 RepID=UPI0025FDCBC3|nr:prepilin-type N-terminal cleavage/methylation domain-containing protein [Persephonella sp.]